MSHFANRAGATLQAHRRQGPKGHNDPVKRAVFVLFIPIVAIVSIGCGGYVPSSATTAHSPQFCTSLKPVVQAGQRLPSILGGMSSRILSETKAQLLTGINMTLNTIQSVRVQLRSGPANVRRAFNQFDSAEAKFKTDLRHATTKHQVRAVSMELVASLSKVAPFIAYLRTHCEGSVRMGDPATP